MRLPARAMAMTAPAGATTAPAGATTAPDGATTAPARATAAPDGATTAPARATAAPATLLTAHHDSDSALFIGVGVYRIVAPDTASYQGYNLTWRSRHAPSQGVPAPSRQVGSAARHQHGNSPNCRGTRNPSSGGPEPSPCKAQSLTVIWPRSQP